MRKRICKATGCCRLVDMDKGEVYCIEHQALAARDREARANRYKPYENAQHGRWDEMYNSPRWKTLRKNKLESEPFCEICGALATEVHHRVPHNGDWDLFLDSNNLMSICHECHLIETQKESVQRRKEHERDKARRKLWY